MYRRYSQTNGTTATLSQMKRSRIKDILILVLTGLLIAALVIGIPAIQKGSNVRTIYIRRIQSECDEALRQVTSLSRNAGADSASILAKIRSSLYAVQVISDISASQGNGVLVSNDQILTIQNTVDRYLDYLTTGMKTGEYQTALQNALEELQQTLNALD